LRIKHVFFDLDHTLWDFEVNSKKAYIKVFNNASIRIDVNKFLNYYRIINLRYWKLYREDKVTKEELRYGRLKETFDLLKYNVSNEEINFIANDYLNILPLYNQLLDGTHELLSNLHAKYQLHIITNGFSQVQHIKLEKSGIEKYFDKVITSEMVGAKKPSPKIFEFAIEMANANIRESVMIGDNWEADIMGAKSFGMNVIYCNFDNSDLDSAIPSLENLLEIKNYL
jgi:putative hydrolase of the HAD superfamily